MQHAYIQVIFNFFEVCKLCSKTLTIVPRSNKVMDTKSYASSRKYEFWVNYQIWVLRHQMISKWPLNDLKWPIRTWKLNFLTKSHFWACNMSFHRFFLTPNWFNFQVTKWPKGPENLTSLHNLILGHVICLFKGFFECWVDCTYRVLHHGTNSITACLCLPKNPQVRGTTSVTLLGVAALNGVCWIESI